MGNQHSKRKTTNHSTPFLSEDHKESSDGECQPTVCACKSILRLGSRRLCAGCGAVGCRVCLPAVIEGHGFCADKCRHRPGEYSVALTLVGAMADKSREDRAVIWGNVADSLGSDEFVVVPTKIYSTECKKGKIPKWYNSAKPKEYSKQQCYVEALNLHTSSETAHYWVCIALQMSWFDKVTITHPNGTTLSLSPLACYRTALCYPSELANPLNWLNLGAQMPPFLRPQKLLADDLCSFNNQDSTNKFDAAACIRQAARLSKGAEEKPYYARCCETLASLLADKHHVKQSGEEDEELGDDESKRRWDECIYDALKAESDRCKSAFKNYQGAVSPLVPTPTPRIVTEKLWRDYRSANAALSSVFTTLVSILAKVGAETSQSGDYTKLVDGVNDAAAKISGQGIKFPRFDGDDDVQHELVYVMLKCTFFAAMLNPANGSSFFNLETFIKHYLERRSVSGRIRRLSVGSDDVRDQESPAMSPAESPAPSRVSINADEPSGNIQNDIPPSAADAVTGFWSETRDKGLTDTLREFAFLQHERRSHENTLYHNHRGDIFYSPTSKELLDLPPDVPGKAKSCKSLLDFIVDRGLPMPTVKMRLLLSLTYPDHPAIQQLHEQFQLKTPRKRIDGGRYGVVFEGVHLPHNRGGTDSHQKDLAVKLLPFDAAEGTALSRVYNDCSRHREIVILLNTRFENIIVRCMHVKVSPNNDTPFLEEVDRRAPRVIEMYMELARTTLAHYAKLQQRGEEGGEQTLSARDELIDIKGSWFNRYDKNCRFKAERLPSGLGVSMVAKFAIDLLNKLEALHSMDLVHKDIKPANILVFDDTLKFADFGFSAAIQRNAFNVRANSVHSDAFDDDDEPFHVGGSSGYLSPEAKYWMDSGRVDNCTDAAIDLYKANDVFALGATLLYLCTGVDPPEASVDFPDVGSPDALDDYAKFNENHTILELCGVRKDEIHPTLRYVISALTRPDYGGAMFHPFFKTPADSKTYRHPRVQASGFGELEKKIRANILE